MIKTTLGIDGMMCGMCEAHMNDLVRKNFQVKKVTSSVKDGETVVISEENLKLILMLKCPLALFCARGFFSYNRKFQRKDALVAI